MVVDDEPPARRLLAALVRSDRELELVGEYVNGAAALAALDERPADLVLLDVQMPALDGISFVESLPVEKPMPYIIFVTAHDGYAVRAFELEALDYLLKPIEKGRFKQSMERAKEAVRQRMISGLTEQIFHLTKSRRQEAARVEREEGLIVRKGDRLVDVALEEIVWVEASNQYVRIHTREGAYTLAGTLSTFAKRRLDERFVRIHRSTIVNPSKIVKVLPKSNGTHEIELATGDFVTLARSRKNLVPDLLRRAKQTTPRGFGS
ncbi:MAG: LytTR family DNA-binding domain-containing protein [Acidobacteriota bacterium]